MHSVCSVIWFSCGLELSQSAAAATCCQVKSQLRHLVLSCKTALLHCPVCRQKLSTERCQLIGCQRRASTTIKKLLVFCKRACPCPQVRSAGAQSLPSPQPQPTQAQGQHPTQAAPAAYWSCLKWLHGAPLGHWPRPSLKPAAVAAAVHCLLQRHAQQARVKGRKRLR